MAIFPIVKGQTPDKTHFIPPRGSSVSAPTSQPPKQVEDDDGDLIDFGQNDEPPPVTFTADKEAISAKPTPPAPAKSAEIEGMLHSTGKLADGPLIDFHEDMQKAVPSIKRSDTEGTTEFVDALE
jgi:oxysterol-binding protein-related protein 8